MSLLAHEKRMEKLRLGSIRASRMKRKPTRHEKLMIDLLLDHGYWFKFQPFFHDEKTLFIPDFRLTNGQQKLILEIDGASHRHQREYDEQRTAWLGRHRNCIVLRVTNEQVENNPSHVLALLELFETKKRDSNGIG